MRANTAYWASRLQGITHCSFGRAYSNTFLPAKKVNSVSTIPAEEVPQHGGPKPGTPAFGSLFKDSSEVFLVKFDPYSEEEVEGIPDKKSQGTLKSLKENAVDQELQEEEVMDPKQLFRPSADRPPRNPHYQQEMKLKEIQMPHNVLTTFVQAAWSVSEVNETMAWLTGRVEQRGKGKNKRTVVQVSGMFLPKQESNRWSVWEPKDAEIPHQMLQHMQESETYVVGWIHSHPTFSSFLSSVDMHSQFQLQSDLAMAFAVVVDQDRKPRVMRLSEKGMAVLAECKLDPCAFHEHPFPHEELVVDVPFHFVQIDDQIQSAVSAAFQQRRDAGSSSAAGDSSYTGDPEETLQTQRERATALSILLKGLTQAQRMIDGYTKLLPRILSKDEAALKELEDTFREAVEANPAFDEFLSPLGFEGGALSATIDWVNLSEALVANRNTLQQSVDELMVAPVAKKRDGSKSTLILFDLKELRIKLGALKWTELRVLKAKTGLGQVTLEIDLEFLKQAGKGSQLPGMDEYESPADPSEHEEVPDADTAADFAAMGLTEPHGVPDLELDPESTGSLVVPSLEEALENLLDEDPDSESQEEEISVPVFLDSEGNLVCSSEDVEKVPPDTSATMIEAEGAKGAYTKSEAWIFLNAKGLALVPPLQGCGLCYNRTDAGMCATVSKSFQIEDTG
eukprot:Skav227972  [mRNA]  locus=scaffold3773:2640:8668:- [translate_table: standard]